MTAEGVFPKVAGDIAYASEANMFYNSITTPKYISTGSKIAKLSGSNNQAIGSWLVNGFSGSAIVFMSADLISADNISETNTLSINAGGVGFADFSCAAANAYSVGGGIPNFISAFTTVISGTYLFLNTKHTGGTAGSVIASNVKLFSMTPMTVSGSF